MNPLDDALTALERVTGYRPVQSGDGYKARCPCHEDHNPSLSVKMNGRLLLHCFAGCPYDHIIAALNLTPEPSAVQRQIVATYAYRDAAGVEVRQKIRYAPKDFRIRHRGAAGEWIYKAGPGPAVLYRLPELRSAIAQGATVFVVEGEKDCDRLAAGGLTATTNIEGAAKPDQKAKWRREYTAQLAGAARVVLLPDHDEPGRAHMQTLAHALRSQVGEVRMLELPGLPAKGDVSDWLNQGHTLDELQALAEQAPSLAAAESDPVRRATAEERGGAVDEAHLATFFQTDLGNSERLVARYGRDLRYCYDFGKWLVWDGIRWALDRTGAALDQAKETARKMLAEAATLADKEDSRKLAAWSFRSQARDRMTAMLYLAQPDVSVLPEQLDTHPWLLNVANGTIDLRTGALHPADRAHLLTKQSPVVYDPHATCRPFLAFMDRIFQGNTALIRFVQKAAGYSLTGLDTEECFFVLWGVGQNGKSTFVETLSALLGTDYAQQATPDLLMQKKQDRHATELAVLRGARLVTSVETGQGKRLNEVLIKAMTGGDRIRANFMHQDTFEFRPEFKVWLSTNHKPVIAGTDLGIWRRIRLIPFTYCIPDHEKDGGFKARLREPVALSGILNWALEGVLLWQQEGLKPPQAVLDATQAYREEMDVLASWMADCCVVTKRAEAKAADLYASYSNWCEVQGERPESQRSFGLRLVERGFEQKKRTGGTRYWLGIGLLVDGGVSGVSGVISDIKEANLQ
ncbi:MAG TPA: phage/plasmid primase, P4 family [Candidatus Contendobacter sp.]|nr:phage/plasmid primase, P4 family [Candidatus Contendobacter sp.]